MKMIHYLRALAAKLQGLFGDRRADQELDDEIETHLRLLAERYVRQGMTEAEAAWAARRQCGNVTLLQEVNREMRGIRVIDTLVQDLRYGVRMLRKNPSFTLIAVITLALGIGANTAIFSVADKLLLRQLPVKDPSRLTLISAESVNPKFLNTIFSYPDYVDYRDQNEVFSDLFAFNAQTVKTGAGEQSDKISLELVSGNYFDALGMAAAHGRVIRDE